MPAASLHRLIVSVGSLDRALALYGSVLGMRVDRRAHGFAWLRTGDGVELMLHERPATASDAAVALSFTVDDLEDAATRWVDAGGAVVDAPAAQPWGERQAVVRDADGHIVCLVQRA